MKVEECVPVTSISGEAFPPIIRVLSWCSTAVLQPVNPVSLICDVWAGGPHMPTVLCNIVLFVLAEFKSHANMRSFSPHNELL